MAADADALLQEAQRAAGAGDWHAARAAFESAVRVREAPEALAGLGNVLWWLGDSEAAVRALERAYGAFRRAGEAGEATLAAVFLCLLHRASLGNHAASHGWLECAARLVEDHDLPAQRGWVLLCRAVGANDERDAAAAERWATAAAAEARAGGDRDLELCALSERGAALVAGGRLDDGARLLDEAMAASLGGEPESPDTVVLTSCSTIIACSRAGDFKRARQWVRAADAFNERFGSPHLYAVCRTHLGAVHFATGRWAQAETELRAAISLARTAEPALRAEALGRLAELRAAQGRPEEAARLLEGLEDEPLAARARAVWQLAAARSEEAAPALRRRLQEVGDDSVEGAGLLDLLVEAQAAPDGAQRATRVLAGAAGRDAIAAPAARALGRALLADGRREAACEALERALAGFRRLDAPYEGARTRLLLAGALAPAAPTAAVAEARAALAGLERLGAARDADAAAALLRTLGVRAARGGRGGTSVLTAREREVLALLGEGLSNPAIAERLFISRKTVERHVANVLAKLDLRGRAEAAAYAVRHDV